MLIRFGQRQRCENTPLWPQYLIALSGLVVLAGNLNLSSVLGSLCRSTTSGMRGLSHFGSVRLPRPATGPSESGMALDSPACIQVFQVLSSPKVSLSLTQNLGPWDACAVSEFRNCQSLVTSMWCKVVGIDLGTTFSVVALKATNGVSLAKVADGGIFAPVEYVNLFIMFIESA